MSAGANRGTQTRWRPSLLLGALVVPLACAMPLLDGAVAPGPALMSPALAAARTQLAVHHHGTARLAAQVETLLARVQSEAGVDLDDLEDLDDLDDLDDTADAADIAAPEPLSPAQLSDLRDDAAAALRALDIKIDPRTQARGPLPDGSGLAQAYAEGRALVLEGRLEQVREWMALAKFGSRDPGPHCGTSPLARYDLVVTRDTRRNVDTAYFHVVVPSAGLPGPGLAGTHEAWIGDERWINLADALAPDGDYLPFKTNSHESLHRQWAKAEVVEALVGIAAEYRQRTGLVLGIGDLSHVTGGKIEDHWTHQKGVDVDLYLLDPSLTDDDGRPLIWWSHVKRGVASWTSEPKGKGQREPALDPNDELSHTATSKRLEVLAQIVFLVDEFGYFVHNDPRVLEPFDDQAQTRRPGRRFLHAENRGYWPTHADHVHLRWVEGQLPPADTTPRP